MGQYVHLPGQGNGFVETVTGATPESVRILRVTRRFKRSGFFLIFFTCNIWRYSSSKTLFVSSVILKALASLRFACESSFAVLGFKEISFAMIFSILFVDFCLIGFVTKIRICSRSLLGRSPLWARPRHLGMPDM